MLGASRSVLPLLAMLSLSGASAVVAQSAPTPSDYDAQVRASIRRVSHHTGILVDPLIVNDMAHNTLLFSGNFCFAERPGGNNKCDATLGAPSVVDSILSAYLIELVQRRPAKIETLASRLATTVGSEIAAAGWPSDEINEIGVVAIPPSLRGATVALQGASGPITLGTGAKYVLLRPGRHTLLLGNGTTVQRQSVSVVALGSSTLQDTPPPTGGVQPFELGRVDAPNLNCKSQPAPTYVGPLAMFNWGRGSIAESDVVRGSNLTPFATQPAIEIKILEEVAGTCNRSCVTSLSIAFASAIAAWRGGCERCGGNMLAVIKIGRNVWLDVRAADRLRALAAGRLAPTDLDLSKPIESEFQRTLVGQRGAATVSYDQIDADGALKARVCATDSLPTPWFAPLKSALCGGGGGFGPLRPTLTLVQNTTSCGAAEDFIACGTPGGGVEVALAGSRFDIAIPDGTSVVIGSADGERINLSKVLVHEVGHWFGVPHSETAGKDAVLDIMSQTYDPRRMCLSAASMIMLNNAADRRWTYAARNLMGLRRARTLQ